MALYGIIAFVIYGWVEFEAMAVVVEGIGGLLAFLGIFVTAIIGIQLLKSQSAIVMASFRSDLAKGQMNKQAVASSLSLLAGAILMLMPGYVTDAFGLLCFVPGLRAIIGAFIATRLNARMMAGMRHPFGAGFRNQSQNEDAFFTQFQSQNDTAPHEPEASSRASSQQKAGDDVIEGEFHEKK